MKVLIVSLFGVALLLSCGTSRKIDSQVIYNGICVHTNAHDQIYLYENGEFTLQAHALFSKTVQGGNYTLNSDTIRFEFKYRDEDEITPFVSLALLKSDGIYFLRKDAYSHIYYFRPQP